MNANPNYLYVRSKNELTAHMFALSGSAHDRLPRLVNIALFEMSGTTIRAGDLDQQAAAVDLTGALPPYSLFPIHAVLSDEA
jgi:hypothetical protein